MKRIIEEGHGNYMKRNAGLSLVELVITISIMAVLVGFLSISIVSVFGLEAKACASDLNAYLKETKTAALSKDYQELKIYAEPTGMKSVDFVVYQYQEDPLDPGVVLPDPMPVVYKTEHLAKEQVEIRFTFSDGSSLTLGGAANSVTLAFQRSSGAFAYAKINDVEISGYCTLIEVERAGKVYEIQLVPSTGKHFIQ